MPKVQKAQTAQTAQRAQKAQKVFSYYLFPQNLINIKELLSSALSASSAKLLILFSATGASTKKYNLSFRQTNFRLSDKLSK